MKLRHCLVFLLWAGLVHAQEPSLTAELSSRTAYLGDAVTLTIKVTHDEAWQVSEPAWADQDKEPSILGIRLERRPPADAQQLFQTVITSQLAWYELGEKKAPALEVILSQEGAENQTLKTPELNIEIITMLNEDDTEPAPVKGQVSLDVPALWPYILGVVCLFALIIGFLVYRHLSKEKPLPPPPPPKPAYEEAIEALNQINASSLLKEGRVKEFYIGVNLIVRHYYARLFGIHAEEMTSFELEDWLRDKPGLPDNLIDLHLRFQEQCDRVKFAKHDPVTAETQETTNSAYQLVELLKPRPQEVRDVSAG